MQHGIEYPLYLIIYRKTQGQKKKGETLVIENHNFEQKESMYIEYRQVYNVKQQTKRFTAMLY